MLGIIGTIIDGKRDNHDQHQECRGELLAAIQVESPRPKAEWRRYS